VKDPGGRVQNSFLDIIKKSLGKIKKFDPKIT
jgi:hypothetical protein